MTPIKPVNNKYALVQLQAIAGQKLIAVVTAIPEGTAIVTAIPHRTATATAVAQLIAVAGS